MLKRSGSLAFGIIALVSLGAGAAYALDPCPPKACRCGTPAPAFLSFTTSLGSGNCGSVVNDSGSSLLVLGCNNLYTGGGAASVPPATVPDSGNSRAKVSCCRGKSLALAAATSGDTGSNRNCTDTGCLFGPPLPITSGASVCVINKVAQPARGVAQCMPGAVNLNLPLNSDIYLTLDTLPKRCNSSSPSPGLGCSTDADCGGVTGSCASDPAVQPCPICNPDTLVCNGGPNNGSACTPGTRLVMGPQWPTSHDCPPPGSPIGTLPVPFLLTSGTAAKTAVDEPSQNRVFCGFCGDPTSSTFRNPAVACTSDADCAAFTTGCGGDPCTACKQRTGGAFGRPGARTVTEIGAPAGPISSGGSTASATLASVFCIPPTFNGAIDSVGDLPGPGAVSLQGTVQLLP